MSAIVGRIVAYIRVSSKGQDYAMQRLEIEREAAAAGDGVVEWFAEKRTAKTTERPELQRLWADVRAGRVRRVYVYRLDRLARSGIKDTLELVAEWRRHGVHIVNLRDPFRVVPPEVTGSQAAVAELMLAIFAWAAQFELDARGERVASAHELATERGEAWGRPADYTPAEWRHVRDLRAEGRTVRQIAMAVGLTRSKVDRMLSRNTPPLLPTPKAAARRAARG